jgi:hypothetical protein
MATLALCVGLGVAAPAARADLEVRLEAINPTTGAVTNSMLLTDTQQHTPGMVSYNGAFGGFAISWVMSTSNSPGQPDLAQLTLDTVEMTLTAPGTSEVRITASSTGFTNPPGPGRATLQSSVGGYFITNPGAAGITNGVTFQSYVDLGNNLFGVDTSSPQVFTSGLQSYTTPGSYGPPDGATFFNLTQVPFSLTSVATITLTGPNASANVSGTAVVHMPVPGSLTMALSALVVVSVCARRQRRQACPVA